MKKLEVKYLDKYFDVKRLVEEKEYIESRLKYEDGAFGHCISLPNIFQISKTHTEHHNNLPYGNILNSCSYLKEIFDSFESEITSFRLLRRKSKTSYGLHHDKDMGKEIVRFQIPIVQPKNSWLCITDVDDIEEEWTDENTYSMLEFGTRFENHYKCYHLPIGYMHHFDTSKIHTLFNDGDIDRVTLLIDVKLNSWVEQFISNFKVR